MPNELAKKMAQILGEISRVPKTGFNDFQRYAYATEADVLDAVRPLLSKYGLAVFYNCVEVQDLENCRTRVTVEFKIIDGDSGECEVMRCFGEARDADKQGRTQDKGIYKAMTGACKYWVFKTFLISTGDDPEHETQSTQAPNGKQQPARSQTKAQANGKPSAPKAISEAQLKRMWALVKESGFTKEGAAAMLHQLGFESSKDVTADRYDEVCGHLQNKDLAEQWNAVTKEEAVA